MLSRRDGDSGFTLVELMTVVLIIGILVSIATPVYVRATTVAEAKSCQANQRTITGAIYMYADGASVSGAADGEFSAGGWWFDRLVPTWIRNAPTCPQNKANYLVAANGAVLGDNGATSGFKADHYAP